MRPEALAIPFATPALDQLADAQFAEIARLVEAHRGIRLPPSKRAMAEGRVRRRALGFKDLAQRGEAIKKLNADVIVPPPPLRLAMAITRTLMAVLSGLRFGDSNRRRSGVHAEACTDGAGRGRKTRRSRN